MWWDIRSSKWIVTSLCKASTVSITSMHFLNSYQIHIIAFEIKKKKQLNLKAKNPNDIISFRQFIYWVLELNFEIIFIFIFMFFFILFFILFWKTYYRPHFILLARRHWHYICFECVSYFIALFKKKKHTKKPKRQTIFSQFIIYLNEIVSWLTTVGNATSNIHEKFPLPSHRTKVVAVAERQMNHP